jgi:sugar/nucleoside kinase (ribokinase family)
MTIHAVYIYGITVLSTIHLLNGDYPAADTYQEIDKTYIIPGGEGANAAVVLQNLGVSTRLDGCCLGEITAQPLKDYLAARGVDCSLLTYNGSFPGWRDMVLCDGKSRTVFGWFGAYFSRGGGLWTSPDETSIRTARCVALDPFFPETSQLAAQMCQYHATDYVTIDTKWDLPMAQNARALVCSREFLENNYPGADIAQLFNQYRQVCRGLLIFTFGGKELWFTSPGQPVSTLPAYKVPVVDTLAAGDTFRAGVVYGILKGLSNEDVVRFASATAAVKCTRFPSVYQPPDLDEIQALLHANPN